MKLSRRGGDPVFVDRTGRRRRLFVVVGSLGGLVLVLVAVALVAGFTGVGSGSVPGWPGAGQARRAAPSPDPSSTVAPRAQATTSAAAVRTVAGAPRSRAAATTAAIPPPTTPATPPPTTAVPGANSHRKVPTQTPTAHPSKRH